MAIAELAPLRPPNEKPAGRGPFGTAPFEAAHGSSSRSPADQQDMKALGHKRQAPTIAYLCIPQVRRQQIILPYRDLEEKKPFGQLGLPGLDSTWTGNVLLTDTDWHRIASHGLG